MKLWLIKNKRLVWAIIIFGMACFFRGYNLFGLLRWWNGDTSRDLLMARHIAFLGDRPVTGPDIAGGAGYLVNSPVYYYLLALVYRLKDDILTIPYFFVIAESVAVVVCFWIMSELDFGLAVIFGLSIAGNSYLNTVSKYSIQPFLLPLITILCIYFWSRAIVSTKVAYFLSYVFICIFSLHVHYAELTLFPALSVGGVWVYAKNHFYGKNWWKLILWVVLWLTIWLVITYKAELFDQFGATGLFTKNNYSILKLMDNLKEVHLGLLFNIIGISNIWLAIIFWIIIYVGGGLVVVLKMREEPLYLLVYLMLCSVNLATPMGGKQSIYLYYVYPYYLIIFLEIFLLLRFARQHIGLWATYFLAVLILFMSVNFSFDFEFVKRLRVSNREVLMANELATVIKKDSVDFHNTYDIIYSDEYTQNGSFGASIFWYFLEKETNKKLVKVVDGLQHSAANFVPIVENPKTIYLVCSSYYKKISLLDNCESSFSLHKKYIDRKYLSTVLIEKTNEKIYYKLVRMIEL